MGKKISRVCQPESGIKLIEYEKDGKFEWGMIISPKMKEYNQKRAIGMARKMKIPYEIREYEK